MSRLLLVRGALAVLLILILLLILIWSLQRKLIYFPDRAVPTLAPGASAVTLETDDGLRLGAWLILPSEGTRDRKLSVLVAHGNAGDREGRMPLAEALAGLGQPIIYFGESLGAAVMTALAVRHPPAGLVLRSPFASLSAAANVHYPWLPAGALLRDRFPVATEIAKVSAPTVIIYGTDDDVVPPAQSAEVAAAAANPLRTVVIPGANHNDPAMQNGPELRAAVHTLLDHLT
jgi:fermentation-respiration switch protein FrsA (DUF1100 family)